MKITGLHKWDLSYSQARELQTQLAGRVEFKPIAGNPKLIAGLDCAFSKDGQKIFACVVVLRLWDFELIEKKNAVRRVSFPYIPGLLSFREAPAWAGATCAPNGEQIEGQSPVKIPQIAE